MHITASTHVPRESLGREFPSAGRNGVMIECTYDNERKKHPHRPPATHGDFPRTDARRDGLDQHSCTSLGHEGALCVWKKFELRATFGLTFVSQDGDGDLLVGELDRTHCLERSDC